MDQKPPPYNILPPLPNNNPYPVQQYPPAAYNPQSLPQTFSGAPQPGMNPAAPIGYPAQSYPAQPYPAQPYPAQPYPPQQPGGYPGGMQYGSQQMYGQPVQQPVYVQQQGSQQDNFLKICMADRKCACTGHLFIGDFPKRTYDGHATCYCLLDLTNTAGTGSAAAATTTNNIIGRHQLISRVVCAQRPDQLLCSLALDESVVVTGFTSGHLNVFEGRKGRLLYSRLIHPTPLTAIRILRPTDSTATAHLPLQLTLDGGVVVMLMLPLDPQSSATIRFHKWRLPQQHSIICLPIGPKLYGTNSFINRPSLPGQSSSLVSSYFHSKRTNDSTDMLLLIGIGEKPLISVAIADQSFGRQPSAAFVGAAASYVGTAVVSLAKSLLPPAVASSVQSQQSISEDISDITVIPPKHLTPLVSLCDDEDGHRSMLRMVCSEPAAVGSMLAISDSLGRIWLFDSVEMEMIRMWKGVRDAQMAFIRPAIGRSSDRLPHTSPLVLAIYHPRRGLIEYYLMRRGPRIYSEKVAKDCILFQFGFGRAALLSTEDGRIIELIIPMAFLEGRKETAEKELNLIEDFKTMASRFQTADSDQIREIFNAFTGALRDKRIPLELKADSLLKLFTNPSVPISAGQHLQLTECVLQCTVVSDVCQRRPDLLIERINASSSDKIDRTDIIITELFTRSYWLSEFIELSATGSGDENAAEQAAEQNRQEMDRYFDAFNEQSISLPTMKLDSIIKVWRNNSRQRKLTDCKFPSALQFLSAFRLSKQSRTEFELEHADGNSSDNQTDLMLANLVFGWDNLYRQSEAESADFAELDRRLKALKRLPINALQLLQLLLSTAFQAISQIDFANRWHIYCMMKILGTVIGKFGSADRQQYAAEELLRFCTGNADLPTTLALALLTNPVINRRRLALTRSEWPDLVQKLADALVLSSNHPGSVNGLTAVSVNSCESLSSHRLLALASLSTSNDSSITNNWFLGRYNPDLFHFYRILERFKLWAVSSNYDNEIFETVIQAYATDLHPQFAVPVGLLVWKKYLEPIIRAVYVLIDRIRKAPRDKMLFKSLESLGTSSAAPLCSSAGMARFLIATSQFIKQLLAANCQIAADDQLEWLELFGRSIKGLIDVKPVNKEWFDYFGRDIFHFCSSMRRLNWQLFSEYRAVCLQLALVVGGRLKSIRLSQLLTPGLHLFEEDLTTNGEEHMGNSANGDSLHQDRVEFIHTTVFSVLSDGGDEEVPFDVGPSKAVLMNKILNLLFELCTVWRSPSPQTNIYRQSIVIAVGRLALICPSEIVTVGYLKETIQPRLPTESLPVLADAFMAKIIRPVLKANNHLLVGDFDKFPASINQWISAPEEANDSVGWMDRNSASDVLICRMDQLLSLVNSWRPADTRLSVICQQLMVTISKQIAV